MGTKVVINKCFGGFGLSNEAERRLIGCGHIKLMEPKEYYDARPDWEQRFAEDQERDSWLLSINVVDGKIVIDEHSRDESRACPRLVAVVEELGAAASSWAAKLAVVEVPDGVEWSIHYYDGLEHVEEVHRTWG
ncbi:MAG TPA: hypothetical protein VGQ44_17490 [Gemmatimonadaceae bacterium]|jgi:hypothetical protein|nr:hypothetical protein [Gemmatimonadaceae bacterium]